MIVVVVVRFLIVLEIVVTGEEDPCKRAALERGMQKAITMFNELAEYLEAEIHYEVVPIRKLVAIQLESGLLTMQYLKDHK